MSENNLKMSSSPHIRSKATTSNIMMLVAIALLPASAFGVWNFGLPAFGMLVTTTVVAVLTEYIYEKLMHKKITINDWSAAVTGLLLGLNMPPTAPWWMGAIGSVFAILIVTVIRRSGTELHEPCPRSKMFPSAFIYKPDDKLCI